MPEGATDSVREHDLDEQVQQLVESIGTTGKDVDARTDDDAQQHDADANTPVAAAEPRPEPEDEADATCDPPEDIIAQDDDAFETPEQVARAKDPVTTDRAPDQDLANSDDFADDSDSIDDPDDVVVESVDEIETAEEPEAAPVMDAAEAAEDAIDEIDQAVDQLVHTAVGGASDPGDDLPDAIGDEASDPKPGPYDEFPVEGDFADADLPDELIDATDSSDTPEPEVVLQFEPAPAVADIPQVETDDDASGDELEPVAQDADPKPSPAPEIARSDPEHRRTPRFAALAGALASSAETIIIAVNAPVRRLKPGARQTIGWVAINTAFLALCVLIVALIRSAL